jgi:hypothetical protein
MGHKNPDEVRQAGTVARLLELDHEREIRQQDQSSVNVRRNRHEKIDAERKRESVLQKIRVLPKGLPNLPDLARGIRRERQLVNQARETRRKIDPIDVENQLHAKNTRAELAMREDDRVGHDPAPFPNDGGRTAQTDISPHFHQRIPTNDPVV